MISEMNRQELYAAAVQCDGVIARMVWTGMAGVAALLLLVFAAENVAGRAGVSDEDAYVLVVLGFLALSLAGLALWARAVHRRAYVAHKLVCGNCGAYLADRVRLAVAFTGCCGKCGAQLLSASAPPRHDISAREIPMETPGPKGEVLVDAQQRESERSALRNVRGELDRIASEEAHQRKVRNRALAVIAVGAVVMMALMAILLGERNTQAPIELPQVDSQQPGKAAK